MKVPEKQELKPVYIHEANYSAKDEISLVDLALILIRRKIMIAVIFFSIVALGVVTAWLTPKSYTFSTSIETGSRVIDGTVIPFEAPEPLLAKMQNVFIPQTLNEQRQSNPEDKKQYKIIARIPKSSVIIVLEIKGTEDKADLMTTLLQKITRQAVQDHKRIHDAVKNSLIALKKRSETELISLGAKGDSLEGKTQILHENIEIYQSQLANLRNTREILPPMRSIEPTGTSRKLIMIIAIFAGVFLGVFSAFFAEFIAKVKERSNEY